jgi:hypothetical protein
MKTVATLLILALFLQADDTLDIFWGRVDRGDLRGSRVTLSGQVNATGCEETPCRLMAYRWIEGAKVLFLLEFREPFTPYVARKKVLDPVHAHCIMVSDFEYNDCFF